MTDRPEGTPEETPAEPADAAQPIESNTDTEPIEVPKLFTQLWP